jgi:hypothetical protein
VLGLIPFLAANGVDFDASDTKIHLATGNTENPPIDAFYAGSFQSWQEHQTKRNFQGAHVLGLISLGAHRWLFAGVYRVLDCQPNPAADGHFLYSTTPLDNQSDLIGRVIVEHRRTRASYIWCKPKIELPIVEIRREKMTVPDFPGYNTVRISHANLKTITRQKIASWHAALANVSGIYLIVDTTTGHPYVGKASGEGGIWQRWIAYIANGHGGNIELKKLLNEKGAEHMQHFQYSILETADTHASELDILSRESHWMDVLKSREFGLN